MFLENLKHPWKLPISQKGSIYWKKVLPYIFKMFFTLKMVILRNVHWKVLWGNLHHCENPRMKPLFLLWTVTQNYTINPNNYIQVGQRRQLKLQLNSKIRDYTRTKSEVVNISVEYEWLIKLQRTKTPFELWNNHHNNQKYTDYFTWKHAPWFYHQPQSYFTYLH